jgi:hypothetical protein
VSDNILELVMRRFFLITLIFILFASEDIYSQSYKFLDRKLQEPELGFYKFNADSGGTVKKSPGGAALRSAIIPGLGQLYNESYWKVPIIYGIGAYLAYEYSRFNTKFKDYSLLHDKSQAEGNLRLTDTYKKYREFYRDYRDSFIWYFALLYLVNILDSYIDAHLYDFNVNNDIQLRLDPQTRGYGVQFRINF